MLSTFLRGSRSAVLCRAGIIIALIALADWRVDANIPLGFLYLFPMLLIGSAFSRLQIAAAAAVCTVLSELFDSYQWEPRTGIPRDILIFAAYFGMGVFVYEVIRNRRAAMLHLQQLESEMTRRREAEEQLQVLVESSPAAIFITDAKGRILLANDAAQRLLGAGEGKLPGRTIASFLPSLANLGALDGGNHFLRTAMQCRGIREDGETFLADVWFSTYATSAGPRMAAMVLDTSEDLRSREESSLHQLLAGSRILVGAVSHEIRNVCGAIAVVHQNLARNGALAQSKDFEALGTLVLALEKIAAMDLRQTSDQAAETDLESLLDELRIVVEPSLRENGIVLEVTLEPGLLPVWADRHSLMQVFLNLIKNSERAMLKQSMRRLAITVRSARHNVQVRISDTGTGVPHPDRLFRPFQQGAQMTGLGLYLSRAFMRSFRGDLRYEPGGPGSTFVVELSPALSVEEEEKNGARYPDFARR